jgi:teichuronic acid biosynthesis glycosyltransferase TuaH
MMMSHISQLDDGFGTVFFSCLNSMKIQSPHSESSLLKGQNILFLSLPKHDNHYTSTPWQIASQLAQENNVTFVDHPYTLIDLFKGFYKSGILKRVKAVFGKTSLKKNNVNVLLTPFVWPINFLPKGKIYNFFLAWNHKILARRINRYLKQSGIDALVYVNSFNFYFPQLPEYLTAQVTLNVYHCIDPMVKTFTIKHGKYLQEIAASGADLIISTAPSLQQNFIRQGYRKSLLVPNAANFELFNKAVHQNQVHKVLDKIEGKMIGYLGNIERRTDFSLLLKVLDILPEWHLVLAGPVERQYVPVEIFNHERIHLTGPISHDEAPSLIRGFDVCIIPFKCDDVSNGIYPLKLYEYMAAGKPVVSTNFNPQILSELADVVHTADTAEQFADFILLAYATDSPARRAKRVEIASKNTWEQRAQLFSTFIINELNTKTRQSYVA